MVQYVKHFCAKLQFHFFDQRKLPAQREVHLVEWESAEHIAAKCSLPPWIAALQHECGGIETAASCDVRIVDVKRHYRDEVGAKTIWPVPEIAGVGDIHRRGGAESVHAIDPPVAQPLIFDIVGKSCGQSMANIEVGRAAIAQGIHYDGLKVRG